MDEPISMDEVSELARELVSIPSETGKEKEVALFIRDYLAPFSDVRLQRVGDERFNVISRLGRGRRVLFSGHIDTVPVGDESLWHFNPYGEIRGGRLYGRGACDMKGPLAAMLASIKALSKEELGFELIFAGVVGEEVDGAGTKALGSGFDLALIGEPTDMKIVRAHKGSVWLEIETKGEEMHSSEVEYELAKRANSIYKMAKIVLKLEGYELELEKRVDPLLSHPTVNVGVIEGGRRANVVPGSCRITVDRRLLPEEGLEGVLSEIGGLLDPLGIEYGLRVVEFREACEVPEDSEIVRLCKEALGEVGVSPIVAGYKATSDMSILVNKGVPTVMVGPGRPEEAHRVDESIELDQLHLASRFYYRFAKLISP